MASVATPGAAARRWGGGTAAIARLLIASAVPLTGVAIARAVGVTQPRASQVLRGFALSDAVEAVDGGYRGHRAKLLDLYRDRSRPSLVEPESYWYGTRPIAEQANQAIELAGDRHVAIAFSADLAPDLLVPWRHPTLTVVYASGSLPLGDVGLVPAEGRADASMIVRWTRDHTLLSGPAGPHLVEGIPITDSVQQWWDLLDLGGEDRAEAADRLRRAIIDRTIGVTP